MNEYQEIMAFLLKMENVFFDEKNKAIAVGDMETYHYNLSKLQKVNEMKYYFKEQYMK